MKIHIILIGVLIILCIFLFLDRACISPKLEVARNELDRQRIVTLEVQLRADEAIEGLNLEIVLRGQKIELLEEDIAKKDLEDVERERRIEELEAEEIALVDEGDKDNIIVNLRKQVNVWKERFSLAQDIIADKDKIIFSLRANYDTQVKITLEVTNKLKSEKALRLSAENVIKEATKEIRRLKIDSKLKTGGIAVIAGVLLYSVLK